MITARPTRDRDLARVNGSSAAIRRAGEHRCTVCGGLMWMINKRRDYR